MFSTLSVTYDFLSDYYDNVKEFAKSEVRLMNRLEDIIEAAKKHRVSSALIIADILYKGKEISGLEAATLLHEVDPDIKVVIISGRPNKRVKILGIGFNIPAEIPYESIVSYEGLLEEEQAAKFFDGILDISKMEHADSMYQNKSRVWAQIRGSIIKTLIENHRLIADIEDALNRNGLWFERSEALSN